MAKRKKRKPKQVGVRHFAQWIVHSKIHLANFLILSSLAIIMPGQNKLQTLTLHPQSPKLNHLDLDISQFPDVPIIATSSAAPQLSSRAAIVIDPDSSAILYQKNPNARLLPASTTKIMTALVAMDIFDLNDIITIQNANQSIGHKARLSAGESLYVKDLIKAMMINSGNDAALALAQNHPDGYRTFISDMNQKALEFHLQNTHYANVSGIETPGHYSSVRDLALLTKEAMKDDFFRSVVATKQTTITDTTGKLSHLLQNINELLGRVEGLQGVKTGWTQNAGECLVTYTKRNGHPIITVVLGSQDRFGESETLIDWTYQTHTWVSVDSLLTTLQN